eukprot:15443477-Alexandrium_andersonii.AAC.1
MAGGQRARGPPVLALAAGNQRDDVGAAVGLVGRVVPDRELVLARNLGLPLRPLQARGLLDEAGDLVVLGLEPRGEVELLVRSHSPLVLQDGATLAFEEET